jgi:membrane peptidoglycan carboxypeptidase
MRAGGYAVQGGSTLTQQLAKNMFLTPERTFKRKLQEALLALQLERYYTKDQILTGYLNRVYLGAGAFGVDAAAKTYFGKPATELNLQESAIIAGLLKAPSKYSPATDMNAALARAELVLRAMHDEGYISDQEMLARLPPDRRTCIVRRSQECALHRRLGGTAGAGLYRARSTATSSCRPPSTPSCSGWPRPRWKTRCPARR